MSAPWHYPMIRVEALADNLPLVLAWLDSLDKPGRDLVAAMVQRKAYSDGLSADYDDAVRRLEEFGRATGFPYSGYDAPSNCLYLGGHWK